MNQQTISQQAEAAQKFGKDGMDAMLRSNENVDGDTGSTTAAPWATP